MDEYHSPNFAQKKPGIKESISAKFRHRQNHTVTEVRTLVLFGRRQGLKEQGSLLECRKWCILIWVRSYLGTDMQNLSGTLKMYFIACMLHLN